MFVQNITISVRPRNCRLLRTTCLIALALTMVGCATTPWGKCEPCVGPCHDAPACWGYFPTCWRPWPCPDPCPVYDWDAELGEPLPQGTVPYAGPSMIDPGPPQPGPPLVDPGSPVVEPFAEPPQGEIDSQTPDASFMPYHHSVDPASTEVVTPLIPTVDPNLMDAASLIPPPRLMRPLPMTADESRQVVQARWPSNAIRGRGKSVVPAAAQTPSPPRVLSTVAYEEL